MDDLLLGAWNSGTRGTTQYVLRRAHLGVTLISLRHIAMSYITIFLSTSLVGCRNAPVTPCQGSEVILGRCYRVIPHVLRPVC